MGHSPAPSLSGLDGWQQSAPRSLSQLRGRVVVVWFFSRSSTACLGMVPGLRGLQQQWGEALQVIAIHSPDYARDADPLGLGRAAAMAGMTWPIGMDHRRTVFSRWHEGRSRSGWPSTFVLDADGRVVSQHDGADLEPIRTTVRSLLD